MLTNPHQRRRILALLILLSLGVHSLTGVALWRLSQWLTATDQAAEAPPSFEIIDLTEPANDIQPDRATFVGVANNATTKETVAVPKPPAKPTRPAAPAIKRQGRAEGEAPSASPLEGALPAHQRRAPATALVNTMDGRAGGQMPEAYFPNFKRGGHTYVNVLKHPNVQFLVEMKRQLRTAWNPTPAIRSGLTEELYRAGTIGVVIGVTVDDHGNLREKFILKPSGIPAYDQDALRTFAVSSPFFEPAPADLALDGVADNLLHMSWALVTYLR